jgi:hypothetical protein
LAGDKRAVRDRARVLTEGECVLVAKIGVFAKLAGSSPRAFVISMRHICVDWKKVAYGAFFGSSASFAAAKSVVFAACHNA